MDEKEIKARVDRAVEGAPSPDAYTVAEQVLRDLDKPIVDPVTLICREIASTFCSSIAFQGEVRMGVHDEKPLMQAARAAYNRGLADTNPAPAVKMPDYEWIRDRGTITATATAGTANERIIAIWKDGFNYARG